MTLVPTHYSDLVEGQEYVIIPFHGVRWAGLFMRHGLAGCWFRKLNSPLWHESGPSTDAWPPNVAFLEVRE